MFARMRAALSARRAARLEAEALVYRFGSRGVAMAQTYSEDQALSEDRREYYRRVARIAERRHLGIKGSTSPPSTTGWRAGNAGAAT